MGGLFGLDLVVPCWLSAGTSVGAMGNRPVGIYSLGPSLMVEGEGWGARGLAGAASLGVRRNVRVTLGPKSWGTKDWRLGD